MYTVTVYMCVLAFTNSNHFDFILFLFFYSLLGGRKSCLALFVLFHCSFQLLCFMVSMEQIKIDR